jgi:hypothetical protein
MENTRQMPEPLRINDSGKYELYDYLSANEIAVTSALLLKPNVENNLLATIKIIVKDTKKEFDRFKLMAFQNPYEPGSDKIEILGKFFNPQKHYLLIEPNNTGDEIHFLLYFSKREI